MSQQDNSMVGHESVWQVERLRLSLFLSPTAESTSKLSWEALAGEPPASMESQPRLGVSQEAGPYGGGVLTLLTLPQRIDCALSAPENEAGEFSLIGPLSEALVSFKPVAIRLLTLSPNLIRLAFGAVLMQPTETRENGYQELAKFLPYVQLDAHNSSDFLYRINRRRNSTVLEGTKVNRLSTWAVAALVDVQIPLLPAGNTVRTRERFASRIELDISTAQEWKADLPSDLFENLYQELTDLATEITEQGDRP